jgi:hypothetical protein
MTDDLTSLSNENSSALAKRMDWPIEYAEGYIAGQSCRRYGERLANHYMVGLDNFAVGFRTGYFERPNSFGKAERRRAFLNFDVRAK